MRARPILSLAALPLAATLLGAGMGAHHWAVAHVEHYMADVARTTNCVTCHFDAKGGTLKDRWFQPRYKTPLHIATCGGGDKLYVTAQDADALIVVDAAAGRVEAEIPVGRRPHSLTVNRECSLAYVSNQYGHSLSIVDLERGETIFEMPAGYAPQGVALDPTEETLFVANWLGDDLSVVDLRSREETLRLTGGNNPASLALSPDGGRLVVANQLARPARFPQPPVSEVTVVDTGSKRVVRRYELKNAHLLEGIAVAPEGDLALVTAVRPRNLLPALQVERGWMMTNGLAVIDLTRNRVAHLPLDEVDAFYADPADVAITPDGRYAFVSHGGVDLVSVVHLPSVRDLLREAEERDLEGYANKLSLSRRYVQKRIPTGANPRGLAVSPDGKFLYVAERLEDRLAVVDIDRLEIVGRIDLGGPAHETVARRGEKVFHSSRITLQNQFSCRSCHPNGHLDRLQYDFEPDGLGRSIVDNRTLLGIGNTPPFKWNGKNTSLYMQCGIRFARFLTRSEPFSMDELNALVAYIASLELPPNPYRRPDGSLTPAQQRGKEIFERTLTREGEAIAEKDRCLTCHPPGAFTNLRNEDVGSTSPWDKSPWEGGLKFDTPQLNNIWMSAPYLHDGKALTLEEIWTIHSPNDTHGITSDLGKDGLNDLIEYLKTL